MTDDEFMLKAIMPTYRHEYLGMVEDLKNAKNRFFQGGYEFLRKCASIKGLNWLWFEELSDFDHEKNGCSKEEALEILKGNGKDETERRQADFARR